VEAPFFRRVAIARRIWDKTPEVGARLTKLDKLYDTLSKELRICCGERDEAKLEIFPTRDGYGIIFVAYNGDVYPGGFAPYYLGNVREESIVKIYRENKILEDIRGAKFEGKCGVCEFRFICGGSRARALAREGNILGSDPACLYIPRAWREAQ
jgi:radical SAM protein with 4Fe4S-binding SPASM domain